MTRSRRDCTPNNTYQDKNSAYVRVTQDWTLEPEQWTHYVYWCQSCIGYHCGDRRVYR